MLSASFRDAVSGVEEAEFCVTDLGGVEVAVGLGWAAEGIGFMAAAQTCKGGIYLGARVAPAAICVREARDTKTVRRFSARMIVLVGR